MSNIKWRKRIGGGSRFGGVGACRRQKSNRLMSLPAGRALWSNWTDYKSGCLACAGQSLKKKINNEEVEKSGSRRKLKIPDKMENFQKQKLGSLKFSMKRLVCNGFNLQFLK